MYWHLKKKDWVCILEVSGMISVRYILDTGTWAKMEYPCILGGYNLFFFFWLGGGSFHFHVITIQNLISTLLETFL